MSDSPENIRAWAQSADERGAILEAIRYRDVADQIERLRAGLTKLSNEVLGSMPLLEVQTRRDLGNSNYSILIQRAEEARALLNGDEQTAGQEK